jgi:hypothetical protein
MAEELASAQGGSGGPHILSSDLLLVGRGPRRPRLFCVRIQSAHVGGISSGLGLQREVGRQVIPALSLLRQDTYGLGPLSPPRISCHCRGKRHCSRAPRDVANFPVRIGDQQVREVFFFKFLKRRLVAGKSRYFPDELFAESFDALRVGHGWLQNTGLRVRREGSGAGNPFAVQRSRTAAA